MPGENLRSGLTRLECAVRHDQRINQVAWSPNGRLLATASNDASVRIWDGDGQSLLHTLQRHTNSVYGLSWHPRSQLLASGSLDGFINVWNAVKGEHVFFFRTHSGRINSVAWSPDGKIIAAASSSNAIRFYEVGIPHAVAVLVGHENFVNHVAWSPDGRILASASRDGTVRLWRRGAETPWRVLEDPASGAMLHVAWSPDGEMLASASRDGNIRLWRADGSPLAVLAGHGDTVVSVAFSPDGRFLASKSFDGTVRLWRPMPPIFLDHLDESTFQPIARLDFHPDIANLRLATIDNTIGIYAAVQWRIDPAVLLRTHDQGEALVYRNAKVVLAGDTGVGKSGLALRLLSEKFEPTESTHGRKVRTFRDCVHEQVDGIREQREILLWDLAGQPGYRLIHQLHLHDVTVALVLFDSQHDLDTFAGVRHWARAFDRIRADLSHGYSRRLVTFLVASRIDVGGIPAGRNRIDQITRELGFDDYFETSAKDGTGVAELSQAIHNAIPWETLPLVGSTRLFNKIKDYILDVKKHGRPLAHKAELFKNFKKTIRGPSRILEAEFNACLNSLENTGLVRSMSYGDLVLTQPELLDGYTSAIVHAALDEPDGFGLVKERDILEGRFRMPLGDRLADPKDEALLLNATVEEFLRHELAFREEAQPGKEGASVLIFPSQLVHQRPLESIPGDRHVVISFQGPTLYLYTTLVVRLVWSNAFRKLDLWKNGVELESIETGERSVILLERDEEGRGELALLFPEETGDKTRDALENYVVAFLKRRANAETVVIKRTVACPSCRTVIPPAALQKRRERGFKEIRCMVCETEFCFVAPEELPGYVDPLRSQKHDAVVQMDQSAMNMRRRELARTVLRGKEANNEFDVFLCHNSTERDTVKRIGLQLRKRGIRPWLDEWETRPGQPWQETLKKQFSRVGAVAVFIGEAGAPWQQKDIREILSQFHDQRRPIIPVLLPGSSDPPALSGFLENYTWISMAEESDGFWHRLIWGITGVQPEDWMQGDLGELDENEPQPVKEEENEWQQAKRRAKEIREGLPVLRADGEWESLVGALYELATIYEALGTPHEAIPCLMDALDIRVARELMDGLDASLETLARLSADQAVMWLNKNPHQWNIVAIVLRRAGEKLPETRKRNINILRRAGIERWLAWVRGKLPEESLGLLPRHGAGWPTLRLMRLTLKHIKCFRHLEIGFDFGDGQPSGLPRMVSAIVGDNAHGKSTILQAIALALLGSDLANQIPEMRARKFLSNGEQEGHILAEWRLILDPHAQPEEWGVLHTGLALKRDVEDFQPLDASRMPEKSDHVNGRINLLRRLVGYHWGLCCGYGAYRGLQNPDLSGTPGHAKPVLDRILSLFQHSSTLMDPEQLRKMLETGTPIMSGEGERSVGDGQVVEEADGPSSLTPDLRMKYLELFCGLIPGLALCSSDEGGAYIEERRRGVRDLTQLSDGCNSMSGLLGHLTRHVLEHFRMQALPEEASGIVLIDEMDLHLHPDWQRRVLREFTRAFPNIQFIVTTHSPLVLGGTPDGLAIILRDGPEGEIIAKTDAPSVLGWTADRLFTDVHFGLDSTRDLETDRLLDRYARLLNEKGDDDAEVKELERQIAERIPDGMGDRPVDRKAWERLQEFVKNDLKEMSPNEAAQFLEALRRAMRS